MREFLKGILMFESLDDAQIEEISELIEIRNVRAGEVIIRHEEPIAHIFLLKAGTAKVIIPDDTNQEEVLAVIQEGEVIGELSLVDRDPPSATVIAEDDMVLHAISKDDLIKLMNTNLQLGNKILWSLLTTVVRRLRDTDQSLSFARLLMKFSRSE